MQTLHPVLLFIILFVLLLAALCGLGRFTARDALKQSAGNRVTALLRQLLGVYTRGA